MTRPFFLRNPPEIEICRLEGSHVIPLLELMERVHELDSDRDIVVPCRSGVRNAAAIRRLRTVGFRKLRNPRGGILAWSDEVDPSVPKY